MKKTHDLGRKCPECEEGYLYSVFKSENHNGVEFDDDYIECHTCGYSKKIDNKRNKIHLVEI